MSQAAKQPGLLWKASDRDVGFSAAMHAARTTAKMNMYRKSASDISPALSNRRYSSRRLVDIGVLLITPLGDMIPATVRDVSAGGFRVKADYGVTIGRSLGLAIPGLPRYTGWVAWSYLGEFGLEGTQTISEHAVAHIVALGARSVLP